jgi:type I restriction enzyme S subunit
MMRTYDSYKDSGIEWIGEIPRHWISTPLKHLCRIENGKEFSSIQVESGGYPVYGTGGEFSRCSEFLYHGPSVLLGRKGTIDKPILVYEPFWTSDTIYYTVIKNMIKPEFMFYQVCQIPFSLFSYGSTIPSMTKSHYENMRFPLPPLSEQEQIVSYLDEKTSLIDEMVEKKKRKIELLKEYRTSLINTVVTKGLYPDVPMKDSGIEWIGEIPRHWVVSKVKYTSKVFGRIGYRGYTVEDLVDENEGCITISPGNIYEDVFNLNNVTYLSWEKYHESPEIMIFEGDIIIVKTGSTIGKTCIIPSNVPEMTINPQLIVLKNIQLNKKYMYYLTTCKYFKKLFSTEQTGGTTPTISQEKINDFCVLIPQLNEQEQIVSYLDEKTSEIDKTIELEKKKIELLKEYRQSLISNVVTGKIKVVSE